MNYAPYHKSQRTPLFLTPQPLNGGAGHLDIEGKSTLLVFLLLLLIAAHSTCALMTLAQILSFSSTSIEEVEACFYDFLVTAVNKRARHPSSHGMSCQEVKEVFEANGFCMLASTTVHYIRSFRRR
jgi:hypothetical protein